MAADESERHGKGWYALGPLSDGRGEEKKMVGVVLLIRCPRNLTASSATRQQVSRKMNEQVGAMTQFSFCRLSV
jgi:hypothetical protein